MIHLAGWYKVGARDTRRAELINVQGTQNVLELAYNLKVPRILYTSSLAVYGNTDGQMPDESYLPSAGPFLTEYDRTKYLAHYQVALPLMERGAPITILMPGVAYGPGDPSLIGQMMTLFYRGLFRALPGPEMTVTYVHVEDLAEGHLLALEVGKPGEVYHMSGPALTLGEAVQMWSQASGRPAPLAADVTWVARLHRQRQATDATPKPGYALGFVIGLWFRTVLVAAAGIWALLGSLAGLFAFSAGTIWRAMAPGRAAAEGFLAGFQESSGISNPTLASAFGAIWVGITRGLPLTLLYFTLHAA